MVKISISTLFNDDLHLRHSTLSSTSAAWFDRNPSLLPFERFDLKYTNKGDFVIGFLGGPFMFRVTLSKFEGWRPCPLLPGNSQSYRLLCTWCYLVSYGYCLHPSGMYIFLVCLNKLFFKPLCLKLHL
ncbi:hypothetical protein ACE6H2_022854 [Prunus campanulata]